MVLGVLNGMIVGLLAVGLVLVYRSNRFLNLAHAQLGTLPALVLAKMAIDWGWNWWAAIVPCLALGVGTGVLIDRVVIEPLRRRSSSTASLLLATLGVTQILLALTFVPAVGPNNDKLDVAGYPVPFHAHIAIGSVILGGEHVLVLILSPILVAGIGVFLRYSTLGRMIRAAASNPDAARLCGISTRRVSAVTWGIAGGLAAFTAILQAPSEGSFNAEALGPQLLFLALGAAAFGAFVSIPGALAGGLIIEVVQQLTLGATSNAGDGELAAVVVVLAAILVRGRAIEAAFNLSGAVSEDAGPLPIPTVLQGTALIRRRWVWQGGLPLFAGLLLPLLPYFRTPAHNFELNLVLVNAIVGLSLTVLVGWAGQVSLGHFALVGVGAFVYARFAPHNWSTLVLLVLAGLVGAGVMTVVGLPALRVRGLTLTVTSLGLAVVAPDWLFRQKWFGSTQPFGQVVSPVRVILGVGAPTTERSLYYFGLAVLVASVLMIRALRRSVPGRLVIAVRDNEAASAAFGITPATVRLACLAVTGFMAATAGVIWAVAWRSVAASQFPPQLSLAVLAVPVIGGMGSTGGAVAGATLLFMSTYFLSPSLTFLFGSFGQQLGFQLALGGIAILSMLLSYPAGLAGMARQIWAAAMERLAREYEARAAEPDGPPLVVEGLELAFGARRALDGAYIHVGAGEIVGLIGANGAGKSTLLNVISGALACDRGSIRLMGKEMVGLPAEYRSALGLGRTFQDAHLFPGLTVRETVQVALASSHRTGFVSAALALPWSRSVEQTTSGRADEILARLQLEPFADTLTSTLSTGTRRICDLAAQVAARPRVLLLDEPAAGIAQREAEALGPLLRRIREELDCSLLVVEHDMPLLMGLCDRIYVMEAGRVIAEGTPEEVRANPDVIASYLGTQSSAIDRSGRPARTRKPRVTVR